MPLAVKSPLTDKYYVGVFADIGAAGSIFIPVAGRGKIKAIYVTPHVTCAGTATLVTAKIGGVALANGVVTLGATQAAGTVASAKPSGKTTIDAGQALELATDGGTSTTSPATVTVVVRETGA